MTTQPTTRRAACNCGRLQLTVEGDPVRISTCHCPSVPIAKFVGIRSNH